jgi:ABC-type oligopeptide transport system ATPase subunit
MNDVTPTLEVESLVKHFNAGSHLFGGGATVHAVDGVSLAIAPGEMLGLVGESGSGKSTVGNCVVRLLEPTAGTIRLKGRDITHMSRRQLRPLRHELHIVFQDPYSSLNPRMTCGDIVGEPLRIQAASRGRAVRRSGQGALRQGRTAAELRHRYPHELSGGQRQRVGLARGLIARPLRCSSRTSPSRARRLGAGAIPQPHARPAARHGLLVSIHHARSRNGRVPLRPCRGDVSWDRSSRPRDGRSLRVAEASRTRRRSSRPPSCRTRSCSGRDRGSSSKGDIPSPLTPPSGCRFRTRCPLRAGVGAALARRRSRRSSTSATAPSSPAIS